LTIFSLCIPSLLYSGEGTRFSLPPQVSDRRQTLWESQETLDRWKNKWSLAWLCFFQQTAAAQQNTLVFVRNQGRKENRRLLDWHTRLLSVCLSERESASCQLFSPLLSVCGEDWWERSPFLSVGRKRSEEGRYPGATLGGGGYLCTIYKHRDLSY
jgi:hypothetical protein